ncbi:Spy/CpxP family protein refolding chaperone [Ilyobacter polytropus]|uniref:Zinc resistance-associated protein n=1 Tax=Ilyobacter polytropus (strain ATCC 51220 / DSM 2926 / LMG 16218 / CuHBu1) TaxID=572544 RepID=E3HDX6_ILYPC|nr:periplasmic heavy metal sensor [Ilyobacter polytropus]ADO84588.1 hypothetical protein Ilyop_2836 [Ilyobacter polytropus DSM 2926]
MKKMLIIGILALSATSFANSASVDHSAHNKTEIKSENTKKSGMMNQINNLSAEQQKEYHAIHEKHMSKTKNIMLDIKEINIQIQKEMLNEKSDSKKIARLIDKKSILQADKEKEMLKFKIEVKEKFGIKMMDGMMGKGKKCKMMDKNS